VQLYYIYMQLYYIYMQLYYIYMQLYYIYNTSQQFVARCFYLLIIALTHIERNHELLEVG